VQGQRNRYRSRTRIDPPEFELIAKVAAAFRTTEREELRAELANRLLELKSTPNPAIRNWKAYLAKFLYNKASTWVQAQRRRERRVRSFEAPDPDNPDMPIREPRAGGETEPGLPLALAGLWTDLDPELRRFWLVLAEEDGNQSRAARRLKIHRNTARQWRSKIVEALKAHGFDGP
jgi:DNA-directed RNA polymerase specialized sigma24 family protein